MPLLSKIRTGIATHEVPTRAEHAKNVLTSETYVV